MRTLTFVITAVVAGFAAGCGGSSNPMSPTTGSDPVAASDSGSAPGGTAEGNRQASAAPVGLSGVVRGLNAGAGTFSLVTRGGTRTILCDGDTQVWQQGTRVRVAALKDGQVASIRGYDYARYVLARTVSIN
jgi:hypothetical protein